jgi:hypothetical protein
MNKNNFEKAQSLLDRYAVKLDAYCFSCIPGLYLSGLPIKDLHLIKKQKELLDTLKLSLSALNYTLTNNYELKSISKKVQIRLQDVS